MMWYGLCPLPLPGKPWGSTPTVQSLLMVRNLRTVKAGREAEAEGILTRVDGSETARRELAEIRDSLGEETGSVRDLFRPGLRRALLVGVGLSVFGQMTGVEAGGRC
jgi:hypothetical protein